MSEQQPGQRFGKGMFYLATLAFLGLMTFFFDGVLEKRENPNAKPASYERGDVREVVLRQSRNGHYTVTGSINGNTVFFLVDTGATAVAVPLQVADRLGLEKGPVQYLETANGRIKAWMTRLQTVRVGNIELHDVQAVINPGMGDQAALLGMSFLKKVEMAQSGGEMILRQRVDSE